MLARTTLRFLCELCQRAGDQIDVFEKGIEGQTSQPDRQGLERPASCDKSGEWRICGWDLRYEIVVLDLQRTFHSVRLQFCIHFDDLFCYARMVRREERDADYTDPYR